ncbi:hypothetical protein OIU84_029086 [Salix udensis]|uniref:DUF4283 domain-containing protein n=1 Tax=Salix udensis TaxID=889485 RepID=A0AAD6NNR0_9ROSI|nr:hypothetical protein OIU84_029086 [Salix udensis]
MATKDKNKTIQHEKPQGSWAERVRISDSSTRYTLDQLPRNIEGKTLKISEEITLANVEKWSRCMVGFFPGYRLPYQTVNTIASRVWRQCGLEHVMATSNGFTIFRFKTTDEMHAVMAKGPWMFGGKNIVLQQWHPHFCFDKNKISKMPVWIRLTGLPFPLWTKQGLSLVATMVGRPLSCDEQTFNGTRLDYARLCVEVDANMPYVQQFEIECPLSENPIQIGIEYEWKPSRCEKCKVYGHSCPQPKVPVVQHPVQQDHPLQTNWLRVSTDEHTQIHSFQAPIPFNPISIPQNTPASTSHTPPPTDHPTQTIEPLHHPILNSPLPGHLDHNNQLAKSAKEKGHSDQDIQVTTVLPATPHQEGQYCLQRQTDVSPDLANVSPRPSHSSPPTNGPSHTSPQIQPTQMGHIDPPAQLANPPTTTGLLNQQTPSPKTVKKKRGGRKGR